MEYTLEIDSLLKPLIKKQMLATYYKAKSKTCFNEHQADEKAILESKLKEIEKDNERQKTRVKKEEIPYDLYLEFIADFEKEKKKISDKLAECSKGVSNQEMCVEFAVNYSMKLPSVWDSASYSDRQKLQFLIFPEGISYNRKENKCRTDNVNGAFE